METALKNFLFISTNLGLEPAYQPFQVNPSPVVKVKSDLHTPESFCITLMIAVTNQVVWMEIVSLGYCSAFYSS